MASYATMAKPPPAGHWEIYDDFMAPRLAAFFEQKQEASGEVLSGVSTGTGGVEESAERLAGALPLIWNVPCTGNPQESA